MYALICRDLVSYILFCGVQLFYLLFLREHRHLLKNMKSECKHCAGTKNVTMYFQYYVNDYQMGSR